MIPPADIPRGLLSPSSPADGKWIAEETSNQQPKPEDQSVEFGGQIGTVDDCNIVMKNNRFIKEPPDIPALTGDAVRKHHENLAEALRDMLAEKQLAHDAEQALRQRLHEEFVEGTEEYIERIQEDGKIAADEITKQMRETAQRVRAMEAGKQGNGAAAA